VAAATIAADPSSRHVSDVAVRFAGFAGLVILGILMICVGLGDGLAAKSEFNQEIIVRGYAPRSERTIHASNLHSAIRFATVTGVSGTGLVIAGLFGILFRG
jgi:hypothetical protein